MFFFNCISYSDLVFECNKNKNNMKDIGSRVECEKIKGTVKWFGEVKGTNGLWYGIDWDTAKKGKHDGSHNGINYFKTSTSTSGSFVRPEKIQLGISIEEAVRGRYQSDTHIQENITTDLQRSLNARFVEVVGMEKIGKKQSDLSALKVVVLDGWPVRCGVENLSLLLPSLKDLDLSNTLIPSWKVLSKIVVQLPKLRFLNVSGNRLELPKDPNTLKGAFVQVTHLVLNHMLTYKWDDFLICLSIFPNLIRAQLSHNNLSTFGPISSEIMQTVEEVDIGVNDICDWTEVCHFGYLPRLKTLNVNSNKLPLISFAEIEIGNKTPLFSNLKALMVAGNPLKAWESVGELNKLHNLTELILTLGTVENKYFLEFTFARLLTLKMLNRTRVNLNERKDNQIFYLRHFSNDYYSNGGSEILSDCKITKEFMEKHPTYFTIVKELGAPFDDRLHKSAKSQTIRDLKLNLIICFPDNTNIDEFTKSVLPSTKVSKLKMMIRRNVNLSPAVDISLWYSYSKNGSDYEIYLENDLKDLYFYSVSCNDRIIVRLK